MINTINESSLHKALKNLYSLNIDCRTEVNINGKIYDIVDKDGNIIEIQTKNLSALYKKILHIISENKKIKVVYPIAKDKFIELYDENNNLISKRKSPVHCSIYDMFLELTKLFDVITNKNFSLDVVEITMIEKRIKKTFPVQSKNNKRRFKKSWIKSDKKLKEIISKHTFENAKDYALLIPKSCKKIFSAKDIKDALKNDSTLPRSASKNAHVFLWVLFHSNIIKLKEKKGNTKYYELC